MSMTWPAKPIAVATPMVRQKRLAKASRQDRESQHQTRE
jgi:hypothetical protein